MLHLRLIIASACLVLLAQIAHAQTGNKMREARELAAQIDRHVAEHLAAAKVTPAPRADDAEFVRRIYLDIAGRIPTVAETRTFLADKSADRRERLVDRLLAGPRYATHFAAVYRALLIPEAGNNFLVRFQQAGFEDWLRGQLARNDGYDKMTRALLTAPLGENNPFAGLGLGGGPSPIAFYSAKEFKAESLAAGTARIFLGVRVECAQCHNHPYADWKKEQFWGLAAFFAGIRSQRAGDILIPAAEMPDKRELKIPGTETIVAARFLDGKQPDWDAGGMGSKTRDVLAAWVTSSANPYFARAAVNRTWAYLLGSGLVEPIDDIVGSAVNPSHPELLDLLSKEFARQQFDTKFLIRAIVLSDAYQRTSAGTDKNQGEPTLFARMPLRGLTPEQLFDSLVTATGFRADSGKENLLEAISGKQSARAQLLSKFAHQTERPTMAQTSILQALTLMNGQIVADATSLKRSETLAAIADAPFLSMRERVETLYLAALSRPPSEKELARMTRFIDDAVSEAGADQKRRDRAAEDVLADVFWVLLNSSEFALNH